ncbi:hypothetical protein FS842_001423 [Serendipita sp. 407]|nr:hypothetical protein FS842_001423 [Serendipita sp. 407]
MLPPELLRVVFQFVADVECRAGAHGQLPLERYQNELESGYKQIETKRSLLLVSRTFHKFALELAWSWISILSEERVQKIDALLKQGLQSKIVDEDGNLATYNPSHWIRRLDIRYHFLAGTYGDESPVLNTIVRIVRSCPRLNVLVTDFAVGGVDCQRTSPLILDTIKQLDITRLDFAGHEGPSLIDYIDLIHHLPNLEQLTTGRIAEPRMEEDKLVDAIRRLGYRPSPGDETLKEEQVALPPLLSWPQLSILHFSHRPLLSSLRLFLHIHLPNLKILYMRNVHLDAFRVGVFFKHVGHQITHIYTTDIRTYDEPFGYARVLQLCPNLVHLTFSPRQDERHAERWEHRHLASLGLRGVLPQTLPKDEELVGNISRSLEKFLARVVDACLDEGLPSLRLIRIEDDGLAPRRMMSRYGASWEGICRRAGVALEDKNGRIIPDEAEEMLLSGLQLDYTEATDVGDPGILSRPVTTARVTRKLIRWLNKVSIS